MKTTKWVLCALLGMGMAVPVSATLPALAQAEESEVTAEAASEIRRDRRDRHNRQWRRAKQRGREAGRRGNAREVLRQFRREMNSSDIVINVCVINVINSAENVVAIGGDVNQVINLIDSANCEIR